MRNLIPIKRLGRHKKFIAVVIVIVLLYEFQIALFGSTPVTGENEDIKEVPREVDLTQQQEVDFTLPENIIPNLRKLLKKDEEFVSVNSPDATCGFPVNNSAQTDTPGYKPNITRSSFSSTERLLFQHLRQKVKWATVKANELIDDAMLPTYDDVLEQDHDQLHQVVVQVDPYKRPAAKKTVKKERKISSSRFRVDLGSYAYYPGGHWIPTTCKPAWKVAIIIPYRDRFDNLNILLRNLVPFLRNQKLEFGIFIAEQGETEIMNRGMMRNIGYQLARYTGTPWDCYIFHDVDYIPMNATDYYGCDDYPKHYAINLEEYNYSNPFLSDFGGVVGMTGAQIERTNGYSNMFWGWGGEDDDVLYRMKVGRYNVSRSAMGYYRTLHHKKKLKNNTCNERFCLLRFKRRRVFAKDGLSAIRYSNGANFSLATLYTNITVDIEREDWNVFPICQHYARHGNSIIAVISVLFYLGLIMGLFSCIVMNSNTISSTLSSEHWSVDDDVGDEGDDEKDVENGTAISEYKKAAKEEEVASRQLQAYLKRCR